MKPSLFKLAAASVATLVVFLVVAGAASPPVTAQYSSAVTVVNTISVAGHPKGIAIDPAANQIYVALFDTSRVVRVDGASGAVVNSHDTGGLHPNQLAFNPNNGRLYVTNRDSDELSFMDAQTLNVIAKYPVGHQPWGVAVDPVSANVYVNNFGSASIMTLDGTNGARLKTFTHPSMSRPGFAAYSTGMRRLYALDWQTGVLFVVDASKQLYAPFYLDSGAFGLGVDASSEKVVMTSRSDNTVRGSDGSVADPTKMWVSATTGLALVPYALAVNPNTHHAFIAGVANGREVVFVIDSQTWGYTQWIDLGATDVNEGGQGVAVNPATNRVYVSNYATNSVTVLQDLAIPLTSSPTATEAVPPTPSETPTEGVPPTATPTDTPVPPTPTSTVTLPPVVTATPTPTTPSAALPYVLSTFPVGKHPKSVTIDGLHRFWGLIALYDDSRIVAFDVTNFSVGTGGFYTLGTHPNQILYAGSNRLHVSNRDSNNYAGFAYMGPGQNCTGPTGELPWGLTATSDRVYVGNFGSKSWGSISVFDLQCSKVATIPLPNDRPAMLTWRNYKLYAAGWSSGNLYAIDANNTVRNPINVGPGAFGLARHDTQSRLYLTNRNDGRVYFIDPTNDNITKVVTLPGKAYGVTVNYKTNHVFVVDGVNDRVYVLDGTTGALLVTLPVGHQDANDGGQGIAVSYENNRIFVTNYADGTMTAIQDVNTPARQASARAACGAPQLASWPNGSTVPYRHATLDWADPRCATRYEFQLRIGSTTGKLIETNANVPFSQYTTIKALKPGKTYYWHVRGCGDAGCTKWSGWWKFTIAPDAK
jgi:YVTN family beta-propeller protein